MLAGPALLAVPLRWSLAVGIVTVLAGIWTTQSRSKTATGTDPVLQELR